MNTIQPRPLAPAGVLGGQRPPHIAAPLRPQPRHVVEPLVDAVGCARRVAEVHGHHVLALTLLHGQRERVAGVEGVRHERPLPVLAVPRRRVHREQQLKRVPRVEPGEIKTKLLSVPVRVAVQVSRLYLCISH